MMFHVKQERGSGERFHVKLRHDRECTKFHVKRFSNCFGNIYIVSRETTVFERKNPSYAACQK